MPTGTQITAAVAVLTFIIAVATLAKAIHEYIRQNSMRRFEKFQDINRKLQHEQMSNICNILEAGDPAIQFISFQQKYEFLSIHEEVAAMLNSKLISKEIAYYFFCGYYEILCDENELFWHEINKTQWVLFNYFVGRMKAMRLSLGGNLPDPTTLRY